jgi:FkbM family methyltransferase
MPLERDKLDDFTRGYPRNSAACALSKSREIMAKSFLKRVTGRAYTALNWALNRRGFRVDRFDQMNFFEPLLYRRLAKAPDFFFVQIGANDGVFADPIREFVTRNNAAGIVVEPLKDFFARLVFNYRDFPRVKPVNVAIHESAKSIGIHRVDPTQSARMGDWTQGIASFKESHHRINQVPDDVMVTETVQCVTLTELLEQHGVRKLDLLQIDTEGYDYEIIKMIDFGVCKPAIIRFEHGLPAHTMSVGDFKQCAALLMDHGYYVITEPYDAIAYQPSMI